MKYSYKWLRELSGTEKTAQEVADMLITHAFEVEDVLAQGKGLEKVVIGDVLTKEKHPDADRLNVATVNVGTEELTIVCGAPNLEAGQKVPVALVGAVLPTEDGEGFKMKKSKIRGVESNGMICAEDELGLGADHEGIMVLPADAPVGESLAAYKGLDDTILDIDILPNRGHDALAHWGMAREIAALEGRRLELPHPNPLPKKEGIDVSLGTEKCARYSAVQLSGVEIGPSPAWMQARLTACGVGVINNVVDITNYVMLETGQPTHIFDAQRLKTHNAKITIDIREAKKGEKLALLDDTEVELTEDDIVITDGSVPIALAGVMGGRDSGVTDETTTIFLEVAHFDSVRIRKTRVRHNIDSDAAYRFERGLDPHLVAQAQVRAVELFQELAGAEVVAALDIFPEPSQPWTITLAHADVVRLLGTEIPVQETTDILTHLGMDVVVVNKETFTVTVPTVRLDLTTPEDLIEEIGRVHGYDLITPTPLTEVVQAPPINALRMFERRTKDFLVMEGCDEIMAYSFYSVDDAAAVGLVDEEHITLLNPMSSEQALMRRSLVPGLLRASAKNMSHSDAPTLFEIGRSYIPRAAGLPEERLLCAVAITKKADDGSQFFALKGMVESFCESMGVSVYCDDVFDVDAAAVIDLHPSRRALLKTSSGEILGVLGEATKKAQKYFGTKKARTAVCEFDLDRLRHHAATQRQFTPLPKFPSVMRDLSMSVGPRTRVADVERILSAVGGELLQAVDLFDLYVNPTTQERSMAFRITFSHAGRTLTAKEVDAAIAVMIAAVEKDDEIHVRTQ